MARDQGPDPKLDLVLDRHVNVPPSLVWDAWTKPEHLKEWFTPRPWTVTVCKVDLRPGGAFDVTMRSPEGAEFPNSGCYLEIVPGERLAWTNALLPGFRPAGPSEGFAFTAILTLEPEAGGTRYVATVLHRDEQGRVQHEAMGFLDGWGKALDQLVEHMKAVGRG